MVQKKKSVFYVHCGHFAILVELSLLPGLLSPNHRCAFSSVLLDLPTFIPAALLTGTGLCIFLRSAGLASEPLKSSSWNKPKGSFFLMFERPLALNGCVSYLLRQRVPGLGYCWGDRSCGQEENIKHWGNWWYTFSIKSDREKQEAGNMKSVMDSYSEGVKLIKFLYFVFKIVKTEFRRLHILLMTHPHKFFSW